MGVGFSTQPYRARPRSQDPFIYVLSVPGLEIPNLKSSDAASLKYEISNVKSSDHDTPSDAELDRILKQLLATLPKNSS
jgi:hypothetical protein